jgi:hypothetical protein
VFALSFFSGLSKTAYSSMKLSFGLETSKY